MTFFYFLSIALFLLCCVCLCLIILVQEGKGGGLGTAFGGEASDSLFGTSTPEILKKFTGYIAGVFLVLCVVLSFWTSSLARQSKAITGTMQQTEIEQ
jgi:preprotein translocase subunit SecG